MSQNLTQPEEIDLILMAMAECNTPVGSPIQDGMQATRACFGYALSVDVKGHSGGVAQQS